MSFKVLNAGCSRLTMDDIDVNASTAELRLQTHRAQVRVRASLTCDYLRSAAFFAREAEGREQGEVTRFEDTAAIEHRAFVRGAVLQSVAGIESAAAEVAMYGPHHHLGSDAADADAREFLQPLAELIDARVP